jgi:putative two-component system response regulator
MINSNKYETNLLIVDDDEQNIKALGRILPKRYHCTSALSGKAALKILAESEILPDLILLDVMMPLMNGFEVCKYVKLDQRLKDIPIIFLSGSGEVENKVKALSFGGVDYITKPFEIDEVILRVDIHIQHLNLKRQFEKMNENLEELVREKVGEIYELQMETIFALTNLVSRRDNYAQGHLNRIQLISKMLSEKLSENPKFKDIVDYSFIFKIYSASPLYDIGNVGIPDHILSKKGGLTDEEFEILKSHTKIGSDTLIGVQKNHANNDFIAMGIDIILSHHEKWDGSGYPNSLRGNQIPLSAQIVAIVEKYDSFLTKYSDKKAPSFEEARETIIQSSGTYFNPELVQEFLEIENSIKELYK